MGAEVKVFAQLIGGVREQCAVQAHTSVGALCEEVAHAVRRPPGSFKLVLKGQTLPATDSYKVKLSDGDVLIVVPVRSPTSKKLVSAVLDTHRGRSTSADDDLDSEDEDEPQAQLPDSAFRWERKALAWAQRLGCRGAGLEWLVVIRPLRIVLFVLFIWGCQVAHRLGLGPPFILVSMIVAIFCNLGKRKAGEASAYSVFNPGVARLPGQMDADQLDQQLRRGQLM